MRDACPGIDMKKNTRRPSEKKRGMGILLLILQGEGHAVLVGLLDFDKLSNCDGDYTYGDVRPKR